MWGERVVRKCDLVERESTDLKMHGSEVGEGEERGGHCFIHLMSYWEVTLVKLRRSVLASWPSLRLRTTSFCIEKLKVRCSAMKVFNLLSISLINGPQQDSISSSRERCRLPNESKSAFKSCRCSVQLANSRYPAASVNSSDRSPFLRLRSWIREVKNTGLIAPSSADSHEGSLVKGELPRMPQPVLGVPLARSLS